MAAVFQRCAFLGVVPSAATSRKLRNCHSARRSSTTTTRRLPTPRQHAPTPRGLRDLRPFAAAVSPSPAQAPVNLNASDLAALSLEINVLSSPPPFAFEALAAVRDALLGSTHAAARETESIGGSIRRAYECLVNTPRGKGLIMLNMLVLLYATNWSVVKMGGDLVDPETFAGLRFGIAAIPFLPWLAKGLKDTKVRNAGLELGFWSYIGYQTQAIALADTLASKAAFLSTVTVLVVPLLSCLDGRGIRPRTALAAVGAFIGVSLLESGGCGEFNGGDIWAMLSAFLFAIQIYRTETHARQLPKESQMPMMATIMVVLSLMSTVSAVGAHPNEAIDMAEHLGTLRATLLGMHLPLAVLAGSVMYTGLATTALTIWLELAALKDVEASDCAIVYTLEPLLGAGIAWFSLGERWGALGWLGAALIIASTLSAQLGCEEEAAVRAE